LKIRRFTVKENNQEQTVVIPETGDKSYDDYLEEAEREKTSNELKKKPPRPEPTLSKKDIAGMLKEHREFRERKKRGDIKKYY
jgi:hypothetical protein